MKNKTLQIRGLIIRQNRGQILVEILTGLAAFLLFIFFIVQICETTMHEAKRFRITKEERHGNQITRDTHSKKSPAHYGRDIRSVFSNRKSSR